jgi:hypothetical protein
MSRHARSWLSTGGVRSIRGVEGYHDAPLLRLDASVSVSCGGLGIRRPAAVAPSRAF